LTILPDAILPPPMCGVAEVYRVEIENGEPVLYFRERPLSHLSSEPYQRR
jgi:hypothetical protein